MLETEGSEVGVDEIEGELVGELDIDIDGDEVTEGKELGVTVSWGCSTGRGSSEGLT